MNQRPIACLILTVALTLPAFAQEGLRFRFMGPAVGNRIASAVGIPGDPSVYYVGAASGGIWKSSDSGANWTPIADNLDAAAIGALALAGSNHSIVWAGTGEAWAIRDSDMMGDGVYKSTDAGQTWQHAGLEETGRIGRIVIHPTDPGVVYVCALGRTTGPQQERGVFKTTDGGRTWQRSLFADPNTGCSGLAMDPNDPNTLFAGMWQVEMHTYAMFSGGPGSALYVSHDAGANWKKLEGHGLPQTPVGKIDVAVAAKNSRRVYALIQTADQGSVWRSDDGGENWTNGSWQRALIGRAGYYIRINVNPANADEVLVANSSFWLSTDGGKSFRNMLWGGDTHDIWMDPDGKRILVTDDAGMYLTKDHGQTSQRVTLPIGQMYHVAVDNDVPYRIYGNMQDDGTMRGSSTTPEAPPGAGRGVGWFGGGRGGVWEHGLGGCESGFTLPDLDDTNIVWASCYGNEVTRYDARTRMARSISPWLHTLDSEPGKARYRCHWTPPLALDPFNQKAVYYGCQVIFRTTNGGNSWSVISPDLSTRDPRYLVSSGGIVGDNLGQFYGEVVVSIAPSEIERGLIWAGTNDGKVWYTRDGDAPQPHWSDVTKNIAGLPPLAVISKIEPSHFDSAVAYVVADFHLMDNRDPWVYKTADYGKSWHKISDSLPKGHPLAYARVIAENPNKPGMLFVGTGNALYYTMNDGATWKQFKEGLPPAPVSWVVVQKQAHDAVVATYGRGLYILDDITPLEQGMAETSSEPFRLVAPRPAYREERGGRARFTYMLAGDPKAPVAIEILDGKGNTVRKLAPVTAHAGMNRAFWDLRYEGPRLVALRTTPPENPHIWEEPRFKGRETRPITHWGIDQAGLGPVAGPGTYTVKVTVDGQTLTQPLDVLRPPNAHGTEADLVAAANLGVQVRDDISAVSGMANQIEWMRRQLEDQQKTVAGKDSLLKLLTGIDQKLQAVEYKLISRSEALSDDKYFVEQDKLYLTLIWLKAEIGTGGGDVAGGGDWGPTETDTAMVLDLEKQLKAVAAEYQGVMEKDVPAYNQSISGSGLEPLKTTGAPPPPGAGQ